MLPFAVLGLILWIFLLLWRINTKAVEMLVKGEGSLSGAGPPAAEEDASAARSPPPDGHSLATGPATSTCNENNSPVTDIASAGPDVKTVEPEPPQTEVNSNASYVPLTTQTPSKSNVPMFSSGPEARERLKFILGASEDNSSDEEPLVAKPPSGTSQPPSSAMKSSPQQASSAVPQSSCTGIK